MALLFFKATYSTSANRGKTLSVPLIHTLHIHTFTIYTQHPHNTYTYTHTHTHKYTWRYKHASGLPILPCTAPPSLSGISGQREWRCLSPVKAGAPAALSGPLLCSLCSGDRGGGVHGGRAGVPEVSVCPQTCLLCAGPPASCTGPDSGAIPFGRGRGCTGAALCRFLSLRWPCWVFAAVRAALQLRGTGAALRWLLSGSAGSRHVARAPGCGAWA